MTTNVVKFPLQQRLDWRPLIIGLEGPPGAGKTASALLLAEGIRRVRGGDIRVLDTEGGRAGKYVGEPIGRHPPVEFSFALMDPPFRATRFLEALTELSAGDPPPACIIVDSISDEHEGEGGRLDWQLEVLQATLERINRSSDQPIPNYDWEADYRGKQKWAPDAWKPSSAARRALALKMTRSPVPLILTFRAREKSDIFADKKPKTKGAEPPKVGWSPVAPDEFIRGCDLLALLPVRSDGVPVWKGQNAYEQFVIKLPEYFKPLADMGSLSPAHGEFLARWAKGEKSAPSRSAPTEQTQSADPQPDPWDGLWTRAKEIVLDHGLDELKKRVARMEPGSEQRQYIDSRMPELEDLDAARRADKSVA
jgi:hypothetical protein